MQKTSDVFAIIMRINSQQMKLLLVFEFVLVNFFYFITVRNDRRINVDRKKLNAIV